MLGGLLDDQTGFTKEKVPLLGDLPVLGNLFRFKTSTKAKSNLMIFLHPTILRDEASASYYSRNKYNDLRNAQIQHNGFFGYDNITTNPTPLLPELKLFYEGQPITDPQNLNTIVPASSSLNQRPALPKLATQENTSAEGSPLIIENAATGDTRLDGPFDSQNK